MRKRIAIAALILCALYIGSGPAKADEQGTVVWQKSGCDWYVAETSGGYVLLEWYGGSVPSEGDAVAGELHSFGMKDLTVRDETTTTHAWIDDYMLSRDRVLEKLGQKCP